MSNKLKAILTTVLCCSLFTGLLSIAAFLKFMLPPQYERYAYGAIGICVAFIITSMFLKICKKTFASVGLKWQSKTPFNFVKGLIIGLLISCLMLFIIMEINGLKLQRISDADIPLFFAWAMSLLMLSFMEEVAFRSYAFINLKNTTGIWTAQITIAILFALYHVAGGQSVMSSFLGPGIWAFIFGWAVLESGGIAMATGIHFAANIVQAAIGQKKQYDAIWQIDMPAPITTSLQNKIDTTGLLIQLALLLAGIVLTYSLAKRKLNATG
ncbi:MAG: CPBP family intramembrane metalloprotease [Sphingobacteriales bacterium]|nr:MAG: CPBP family intramembrane metalloprotease [Sphingobacteriales bacterium]